MTQPDPRTRPSSADVPKHRAVYELHESDGGLVTQKGRPFDARLYSTFKYGNGNALNDYASLLAVLTAFVLKREGRLHDPLVVTGTPYKRVPNAAAFLAKGVTQFLRMRGFDATYTSIYQHQLSQGDYGRLDAAARNLRNRAKVRSFNADDFIGRYVVLVDDVRITGSVEQSVLDVLAGVSTRGLSVCNLVALDPAAVAANPLVEDRLNHAWVKSLGQVGALMRTSSFVLTTRAVRFTLESDIHALEPFLRTLRPEEVQTLYRAAVDDGYDSMPAYRDTFACLERASRPYSLYNFTAQQLSRVPSPEGA